jgi:hypothetical protein
VYGSPTDELRQWCEARNLRLRVFPWLAEYLETGLERDGLYLMRPDTYVALADPTGSPHALERYCAERQIEI